MSLGFKIFISLLFSLIALIVVGGMIMSDSKEGVSTHYPSSQTLSIESISWASESVYYSLFSSSSSDYSLSAKYGAWSPVVITNRSSDSVSASSVNNESSFYSQFIRDSFYEREYNNYASKLSSMNNANTSSFKSSMFDSKEFYEERMNYYSSKINEEKEWSTSLSAWKSSFLAPNDDYPTYNNNNYYGNFNYESLTCSDLKGMGICDIEYGDSNYTSARDRDGDGIACEC